MRIRKMARRVRSTGRMKTQNLWRCGSMTCSASWSSGSSSLHSAHRAHWCGWPKKMNLRWSWRDGFSSLIRRVWKKTVSFVRSSSWLTQWGRSLWRISSSLYFLTPLPLPSRSRSSLKTLSMTPSPTGWYFSLSVNMTNCSITSSVWTVRPAHDDRRSSNSTQKTSFSRGSGTITRYSPIVRLSYKLGLMIRITPRNKWKSHLQRI